MKKPHHGDYLNMRYDGALLRLRCDDITETPNRGVGTANLTIVSNTPFQRGHQAHLINGSEELSVQIERVTVVGRRNIVLLHGSFANTEDTQNPMPIAQA